MTNIFKEFQKVIINDNRSIIKGMIAEIQLYDPRNKLYLVKCLRGPFARTSFWFPQKDLIPEDEDGI